MSSPQLGTFQAKVTETKQNKTAQRCPTSPPQGLLSPPPLLIVLTKPCGGSARPHSPGQRGESEVGVAEAGHRSMNSARTWERCVGVSATPTLLGAQVHFGQKTPRRPLFYATWPFLGEVIGMVGLRRMEEPYLRCRNGNEMEPMGLPQCVREESTLLWEPFMFFPRLVRRKL